MKPLTPKTRSAIIYGKNCGQSGRTIAKQLGCGKTAVYDVLKCLRETDSSTPKKKELAAYLSLIHQLNKSLKLLFKKMLKIVSFVQQNFQLFGQLV